MLTQRELEVLRLAAEGYLDREIGQALIISRWTVRDYWKGLCPKLGARNRAQAVAIGLRTGIIS